MKPEVERKIQSGYSDFFQARLSDREFDKLSGFIMQEYGIKMPPVKKVMLQSRLQKRLKELNMVSFKEYIEYVFSQKGQQEEVIHMIDVVSTNKTDFFREPVHFELLSSQVLPEFYNSHRNNIFRVWSSGCSSGEEPYTMAITLAEFAERNPGFDYSIYATDISTKMLKVAVDAIYKEEKIEIVPLTFKKKYFLRSKNREDQKVRIIPGLRNKIMFERLNLISERYNTPDTYDAVFCRNVLIYFDREVQQDILSKICLRLKRDGYLFLGHSESVTGLDLPLKHLQPTVFKRL
ncbi:MAG: CheR family methyltransferase [Bacteroidales bacterium]